MSLGSPKLERREHAIEATRRRLRRLEIEAHRIKAELARLEAEYEDDVADWLSRKLRRRPSLARQERLDEPPVDGQAADGERRPRVLRFDGKSAQRKPDAADCSDIEATSSPATKPAPPLVVAESSEQIIPARPAVTRKNASPLVLSAVLHAVALVLCLTFSFATLVQQNTLLLASPADLDDEAAEALSEIEIEPTKFDDTELQNVVAAEPDFNIADNLLREFEPAELGAGSQSLGDIGQLDALPSDLGSLMAGAGDAGGGKPGGPLGEAVFFGARSQGNRFVFVVDNSDSMKGGRFETAVAELIRSIESLTPKQAFYVIFVSDQTYPMFYPQPLPDMVPATPEHKKRLAEWVPNAITASGKNRELIKAMDTAAALRPDAIFFLWDGRIDHAGVRQDVMTHLTRPNQWNFPIHTVGMEVTSLDAEYNLTAIAKAHGGTFRRVGATAARPR